MTTTPTLDDAPLRLGLAGGRRVNLAVALAVAGLLAAGGAIAMISTGWEVEAGRVLAGLSAVALYAGLSSAFRAGRMRAHRGVLADAEGFVIDMPGTHVQVSWRSLGYVEWDAPAGTVSLLLRRSTPTGGRRQVLRFRLKDLDGDVAALRAHVEAMAWRYGFEFREPHYRR